jgi:hypothetical protein
MAVLTAQGISDVAIELLTRRLVLPNTVTRIPGGEFAGDNGDTITVRVPQPGLAREQEQRGAEIDFDDVYEVPVDVQMKHLYHAKLTSDEEMSFDIKNFARQVTRVQVDAVGVKAEDQLGAVMNALTGDGEVAGDGSDILDGVNATREFLDRNDAPDDGRWLAVSPEFATAILNNPHLTKVNESGSPSALRRAIIGDLLGFTVVKSNRLDPGTAVGYHTSGFVFANRVPPSVDGAVDSGVSVEGGIGLRQVLDYISTRLSHASILSTFAGSAAVYDWDFDESGEPESGDVAKRFYKLTLGS